MVSRIFLFALIVGMASAATFIGKLPEKPQQFANQDGCYIEEIDKVVPFGSTVTPFGNCYQIHCSRVMIDYSSCGVVYTDDPKCHVTDMDLSRPYPSCCPDIKCEVDNHLY